jgi:hypothetical protein
VKYKTQNGLSLDHAQYRIGPNPTDLTDGSRRYAVFAFADSLGQYSNPQSSSVQKLDLYEYDQDSGWAPTAPNSSELTVGKINARNIDESKTVYDARLCFSSGGTNQSALYTISGRGQLTVSMQIFSQNRTCTP